MVAALRRSPKREALEDPAEFVFAPEHNGISMTAAEFDRAEFDEFFNFELIRGILIVTPIPLEEEADPNDVENHNEYFRLGVKEYWIIDRFQRTMTVHIRGKSSFQTRVVLENETHETPLLPGFVVPLAKLFERSDGWAK